MIKVHLVNLRSTVEAKGTFKVVYVHVHTLQSESSFPRNVLICQCITRYVPVFIFLSGKLTISFSLSAVPYVCTLHEFLTHLCKTYKKSCTV